MTTRARSKVLLLIAGCWLFVAALGGVAYAGFKQEQNVSVTATTASGSIGTARNSADTVQFIKCTIQGFTASNSVFCSARNSAGTSFSCTANGNATLANAVAAIGVGSRLFIVQSGGACTQIDVTNGSDWKPAVP